MKRIYLIDISSFIFRAFYAVRPLTAPDGTPTNAVYGVISMLIKLLKDEKPEYVVVCYDRKEPSFRKDIFPEYKANRAVMPEDLVPQMQIIKNVIQWMGIPTLEVPGYEADDIIGSVAKLGRESFDLDVMIVSGDKDFGQCVRDHVFLVDTMKGTRMGASEVVAKWGVDPKQFIDYLALMGDSSDNIPGVAGIGPKGATNLLKDYGSLDGVYANLDKVKSLSLRAKLENGKESAYLSQKLVTIVDSVPIPIDLTFYHLQGPSTEELRTLLQKLNFKSFEKSLFEEGTFARGGQNRVEDGHVETVLSEFEKPAQAPEPSVLGATETNLLKQSIAILDLEKYFPQGSNVWVSHTERGIFVSDEITVYELQGEIADLGHLSDQLKWRWSGFDLKTFWHIVGLKNPNASWDGMLAAYCIRPGEDVSFDKVYAWSLGRTLNELPTAEELTQAQIDLKNELEKELLRQKSISIYSEYELPLVSILYRMEICGIRLDSEMLKIEGAALGNEIQSLEKIIYEMAGSQFNIASPKQLSQVLFEKMKLTAHKKTKTGYSTDNEVLEKLKAESPIADELLKYRELTKLKSTYVDSLPLLVKEDGRIHTTFNQALTTTGRLSSTDPNLQNIPIKTERGARVRKAFIAEAGNFLLSVDYSQIELRILAHYSQDKNMIQAFEDDLDIHAATASEVFSVPLSAVTSEMRRAAKAVNFGIAYGQGAFGLAENMGIPRSEAQDIIKRYFTRFPGVKEYIENTIEKAKEQGFVETLAGRRRYIDELKSSNGMIRKFGERAAINAPIQGSASDIVKKAMIALESCRLPLLLQVHDELIFEGSPEDLETNRKDIVHVMENVVKMRVPLKANSAIGKNWDEAH